MLYAMQLVLLELSGMSRYSGFHHLTLWFMEKGQGDETWAHIPQKIVVMKNQNGHDYLVQIL
jgi:hypothetical protein